jgi:hypothetical protein
MTTKTRTWIGTPGWPAASMTPWHECDDEKNCSLCGYVVELPLRTADGRTVVAQLTADEAEQLASRLEAAAASARALAD